MKKAELLKYLSGNSWVDAILAEPALQAESASSKWYRVLVREVVDNVMINRSIDIYVIDEGKDTERAYYKDSNPISIINPSIKE